MEEASIARQKKVSRLIVLANKGFQISRNISRQKFLKTTSAIGVSLSVPIMSPQRCWDGTVRADELILVGVIGTGNRARQVIDQLPSPGRIVAIADCYQQRMNETLHQNNASEVPPANPSDNNPGMARVDALNVNVGGLDLPEGTILSRGRGVHYSRCLLMLLKSM